MSDITPEELRLLGGFGKSIVGRALLRSADTIERLQKLANEETHDAEAYFEENKRQAARIAELEQQVELISGKYPESWALAILDIATKRCGYEGVEAAPPSCAVNARLDELEQQVVHLKKSLTNFL